MNAFDNFQCVSEFKAIVFGNTVTSEMTYNHLYWLTELMDELGYFDNEKSKGFDFGEFFKDYIHAFERFYQKVVSFCLTDLEGYIHVQLSDCADLADNENPSFKDLQFREYCFEYLDEKLANQAYFK